MIAVDRDTGKPLSPVEASRASDNPGIWTWVEWVEEPAQVA